MILLPRIGCLDPGYVKFVAKDDAMTVTSMSSVKGVAVGAAAVEFSLLAAYSGYPPDINYHNVVKTVREPAMV